MKLLSEISTVMQILSLTKTESEKLLYNIKQRALCGEFDKLRHIPYDIIENFRKAGLYRTLVPKRFGGNEYSAIEFCKLIECISVADGSVGWVASFAMSPSYFSALSLDTLNLLYRQKNGPDLIFAGGFFPIQKATCVNDGFRVNGKWKYSSGCVSADILGVGILPENNKTKYIPRVALFSKEKVCIEETWNTTGLLGTGSHDLIIKNEFVSNEWTFIRGDKSSQDEAIFRYPSLVFAAQVLSVVGLGVARRAINEVINSSEQNHSATGAPCILQRQNTLKEIAKAEARLRSARSFFYESIEDGWSKIIAGDKLSNNLMNIMRLSASHAVHEASDICRNIQILMGMAGISRTNAISRCVNDAQAITQHAFMNEVTFQNAGSIILGASPSPGYI